MEWGGQCLFGHKINNPPVSERLPYHKPLLAHTSLLSYIPVFEAKTKNEYHKNTYYETNLYKMSDFYSFKFLSFYRFIKFDSN